MYTVRVRFRARDREYIFFDITIPKKMVTGVHGKLAAFVSSCLYMALITINTYLLHGFMCNSISIGRAPPPMFSVCATSTLYILYYKLKTVPSNHKVFPTPLVSFISLLTQ